MKKTLTLAALTAALVSSAQNPLAIPPALTGNDYALTLQNGTTTFYNGITTNTMGANGALLGPTLIMYKDSAVSITVDNQLGEETTIHWHGMHVAPENDGGPHSVIQPGATWNPQFTVMDKAGMNWYHPHLHMMTDKHVSKGIAGLIIVKDEEESNLNLPGTYGVDDFPIVMQTKGFDATGQIEVHTELDTSVMVNGTIQPYLDVPAQVVRLRLLNGSTQRVMEIGFSDNRTFSLIGTDGGLLTAPVDLTRYRMAPGQRADILINLVGEEGMNFQLMSFASELPNGFYGALQPGMGAGATGSLVGYTDNPLNGNDYQLLDLNVVAQTASPVVTIPSTLASFTPLQEGDADITRTLTFTSAGGMGNLAGPFLINGSAFQMEVINYEVPLDNIEIWTLTNQTPIAHPFHIHDVQFFILDINGTPPPPELQGYNDVVLVPAGMGTVRFIAQFSDFTNDTIPYMYHCHMLTHEDMGMMGQFLVKDSGFTAIDAPKMNSFDVYPNPSTGEVFISSENISERTDDIQIYTMTGQKVEVEFTTLSTDKIYFNLETPGIYIIQYLENNVLISKKIVVE